MKVQFTILKFAELNKVARDDAYGLFGFLKATGLVAKVGTTGAKPGARGKGQDIYEGDPKAITEFLAGMKFE